MSVAAGAADGDEAEADEAEADEAEAEADEEDEAEADGTAVDTAVLLAGLAAVCRARRADGAAGRCPRRWGDAQGNSVGQR
ncbi:hypothetical protein GCM10010519_60960 [Streptomyces lactacystinicus]